jgi:hypothetical protein
MITRTYIKENNMSKYIDELPQPVFGHELKLPDGQAFLTSVRMIKLTQPDDQVIQVDDFEAGTLSMDEGDGLLVEACDTEHFDEGSIAHVVFKLKDGVLAVGDADVLYAYRGNGIAQSLIELAVKLTGTKTQTFEPGSFKYL